MFSNSRQLSPSLHDVMNLAGLSKYIGRNTNIPASKQ